MQLPTHVEMTCSKQHGMQQHPTHQVEARATNGLPQLHVMFRFLFHEQGSLLTMRKLQATLGVTSRRVAARNLLAQGKSRTSLGT